MKKNSNNRTTTGTSSPLDIQKSAFDIVSIFIIVISLVVSCANDTKQYDKQIGDKEYFKS